MNSTLVTIAIALLPVVFSAGIYVAVTRQNKRDTADLRKEVNGVGAKVGRLEAESARAALAAREENDSRTLTIAVAMMAFCKPEDRERLAEMLLRAGKR
jgi:hypothetical protein